MCELTRKYTETREEIYRLVANLRTQKESESYVSKPLRCNAPNYEGREKDTANESCKTKENVTLNQAYQDYATHSTATLIER